MAILVVMVLAAICPGVFLHGTNLHSCSHHLVNDAALKGEVVDTSGNTKGRILQAENWHKLRIKIDYSRKPPPV